MANDPRKLIVLGFESALKAKEALLAATRLQTEGQIALHDAVFVTKDEDGSRARPRRWKCTSRRFSEERVEPLGNAYVLPCGVHLDHAARAA
jgi:hypothetical protein